MNWCISVSSMITSWIRRKALKKTTKGQYLIAQGHLSPVMLMSLAGILVLLGVFVVHHTLAAVRDSPEPVRAVQTP